VLPVPLSWLVSSSVLESYGQGRGQKPLDTGSRCAVIRLPLWGSRGASEQADEVTSQHRHGAWCWDKITLLLRQAGHRVIAPDLPGHGHDTTPLTARPYERYVPSVCAILERQTEPVILLGHSSGGAVITAAAERHPEHVSVLVYLAAFLLPDGITPPEVMRTDTESLLLSALRVDHERQTVTVAAEHAKEVFYADCTDADAAWATSLLVPEPLIPRGTAAVSAPATIAEGVPRIYIATLKDKALGPTTQRRMYTALPCQKVYTLPTSHSPFLSAPEQLVACLLDIGSSFNADEMCS